MRRSGTSPVNERPDTILGQLIDDYHAAKNAEIPSLVEIRECDERIIKYYTRCVLEEIGWYREPVIRYPALRLITNDGPVRHNPQHMSSPMKTDEIRAFESTINRVFGIGASAMTEWPTEPA